MGISDMYKMTEAAHALLCKLLESGPMMLEDVQDFEARRVLVTGGLAARIVMNGSDGYLAATAEGINACFNLAGEHAHNRRQAAEEANQIIGAAMGAPALAAPATEQCLQLTLSDGSVWNVPTRLIARSRAEYYAPRDFGGDVESSLAEDTLPLFKSDKSEIRDWAENNMNWCEVKAHAYQVAPSSLDMDDEWCNCEKSIVTAPVRA